MPLNLIQPQTPSTPLPRLATVFNEYAKLHMERPNYWTRPEIYANCKDAIKRNLNTYAGIYSPFATDRQPSWYNPEMRMLRKLFGKHLANAFREEDVDEALEVLHSRALSGARILDCSKTDFADLIRTKCGDPSVYTCNDCNHIDHEDNGSYVYDDTWVCDSCREDNYTYSENRGTYISNDDYEEEQEHDSDDEDNVIGDYHDSKRVLGHIPSKYDAYKSPDRPTQPILLGLELEVEVNESYNSGDKATELYDEIKYVTDHNGKMHQYCFAERDGSLNHGFEIVTGYTGLDVHAKQLEFFKSPWSGVRSHDTRTCGLHVHIDKAGMSLFHACKMVFFIHDSNNQKLIKDIARRANADYAQIKNKKASYQWLKRAKSSGNPLNYLNEDRREALNFQNDNTIEFRLFKGTLRYETIMACLEFTYATWFFCRDTGITELTTPNFVDFICQPQQREHTKFLRSYLKEKGYSLPRLALVKPNPRSADYKPQPVEQLVA